MEISTFNIVKGGEVLTTLPGDEPHAHPAEGSAGLA
jgi:hypothetical protein